MRFLDALSWFVIVCVALRALAIEVQLRTANTSTIAGLIHYMRLSDVARQQQVRTLAVGVVAVLWLVFG